jgi:hypothetical protein
MSTEQPAATVAEALAVVQQWRAESTARQEAELQEVDQEIASLQSAVENLQQQLHALQSFKTELAAKTSELDTDAAQREYRAIFATLQSQANALGERGTAVVAAQKARLDDLPARLAASDAAADVAEYEQFKANVEPTLKHLPDSYRDALLEVHQKKVAKVRRHVEAALSGPVEVTGEEVAVDVVYAIDAPEGTPELIIVVVPVADDVHTNWVNRSEGVQMWVAARVAQALYQAAHEVGFVQAQALSGGHLDLLAVEMELVGADTKIGDALRKHLANLGNSPELTAAKVKVSAQELPIDTLLPPEPEEDDAE